MEGKRGKGERREGLTRSKDRVAGRKTGKGGKRDAKKKESDGWRSISRKFVRKCWPGEMESGVACLFWLSGRPPQAPSPGTGREGCRGISGGEEGRIRDED